MLLGANASIVEVIRFRGQVRPGDQEKHEHFGYRDGVSQPAVIGWHKPPKPELPKPVRPGVLLFGKSLINNLLFI